MAVIGHFNLKRSLFCTMSFFAHDELGDDDDEDVDTNTDAEDKSEGEGSDAWSDEGGEEAEEI